MNKIEIKNLLNELSDSSKERNPESIDKLINLVTSPEDNFLKKIYRDEKLNIDEFEVSSNYIKGKGLCFMPQPIKFIGEETTNLARAALIPQKEEFIDLDVIGDTPITPRLTKEEQNKVLQLLNDNES